MSSYISDLNDINNVVNFKSDESAQSTYIWFWNVPTVENGPSWNAKLLFVLIRDIWEYIISIKY